MARCLGLALSVAVLGGCVPAPGPFVLAAARGRVLDADTGEPIRGAEVFQWYRGSGPSDASRPVYHSRWTSTDEDGRFGFERALSPSPRMWLLRTYGPSYGFYHPSYGLVHGGAAGTEGTLTLRGSLRDSALRLADLAPYCRGERDGRGARHLAEIACPPDARRAWPDGTPRTRGHVDERGRRTGVWTFYYENGGVAARGTYRDGAAVGRWEFRDREGRVVPASGATPPPPSASDDGDRDPARGAAGDPNGVSR